MSSPSTRVIGLDILRCCAILGVLVAHGLTFLYPHVPPIPIGDWTFLLGYLGHGGFYGVELFFVLSGFLIGRILLRTGDRLSEPSELLRFWSRRWFRTLPAYLLFLLINLAVILWVFSQPVPWDRFSGYLVFIQNFSNYGVFFFPESWSLAVEEWFYLLFPAVMWLLYRLRLPRDVVILGAGAAFYIFSTGVRWQFGADPAVDWTVEPRVVTIARFDAMMVGILAAWISLRYSSAFERFKWPTAIIGLASLGYAYTTLYAPAEAQSRLFAETLRFNLVSFGFACLLPWGLHAKTTRIAGLDTGIRALACWSYSMYLSHMLVLRFLAERWMPEFNASPIQGYVAFVLFITITIGLSALVYRGFEKPFTAMRDRFAFSRD